MGYDEAFVPFAVAAITPLGCAWVASRFVPPTNKWIYGGVVIGTAYLSWKYIVPRMLTSMGYPVPFEAESNSAEKCANCKKLEKKNEILFEEAYSLFEYDSGAYDDYMKRLHDEGVCDGKDEAGFYPCFYCHQIDHPNEDWNAESKFRRPYDRKGKIDLRRDNKGRYRRKLSVPLKKNAEGDSQNIFRIAQHYEMQARWARNVVDRAISKGCFSDEFVETLQDEADELGMSVGSRK